MHTNKIKTKIDLDLLAKKQGEKICLTNGVYDLLHKGHVSNLSYCKQNCDKLVVLISTDRIVKRLKGDERPIQTLSVRAEALAALDVVDVVVVWDELRVTKALNLLRPDLWAKGADYSLDTLDKDELNAAKSNDINILFVPITTGYSTTNIINGLIDETKVCVKCYEHKPLSAFSKVTKNKPNLRHVCKVCMAAIGREAYKKNAEKNKKREKLYRVKNAKKIRARGAKHYRENIESAKNRILIRTYGIGLSEYMALLAKQGGCCAICGKKDNPDGRRLYIDHDHASGAVRGLLCHNCNSALGHAFDSPERLHDLADYLENHSKQKDPETSFLGGK